MRVVARPLQHARQAGGSTACCRIRTTTRHRKAVAYTPMSRFPDRDVRMYTTKAPPKRGLAGVDNAARTRDLLNHNQLLYRLSYIHHVCHPVSRIRTTDGYYTGFSRQREFGASRRSRTTGNGVDHPAAYDRNAHRQPRHVLFRSLQPYAMSATKHWVFAARTGWTMCVLPGILKAEAGVMVGWESIRR